jgi:hypothetical protein
MPFPQNHGWNISEFGFSRKRLVAFSRSLLIPFHVSSSLNPRPDLVLEGCWQDIREAPAAAALAAWPARAGGDPWLPMPMASCAPWLAVSRVAQPGIYWPN